MRQLQRLKKSFAPTLGTEQQLSAETDVAVQEVEEEAGGQSKAAEVVEVLFRRLLIKEVIAGDGWAIKGCGELPIFRFS